VTLVSQWRHALGLQRRGGNEGTPGGITYARLRFRFFFFLAERACSKQGGRVAVSAVIGHVSRRVAVRRASAVRHPGEMPYKVSQRE